MQIISLNNQIVRKALCLSLNEMAVLCDIKQMSQNPDYGYTCVKSKDKIAEWLDLSRSTVFTIVDTLIKKGYVEKNQIGLKPTRAIYALDMAQEEIGLWLKNGEQELVTKKINEIFDRRTDSPDSGFSQSRNWTVDTHIGTQEEKPSKKNGGVPPPSKKKGFVPPTEQEVLAYFQENGQTEFQAKKAYVYYAKFDWTDSQGKKVKNWKQKMLNNWFTDLPSVQAVAPLEGDEKMWSIINKGFANCTQSELKWVFEWQHRTGSSYLQYADNIRLVRGDSPMTKQDCIDADRAAGY